MSNSLTDCYFLFISTIVNWYFLYLRTTGSIPLLVKSPMTFTKQVLRFIPELYHILSTLFMKPCILLNVKICNTLGRHSLHLHVAEPLGDDFGFVSIFLVVCTRCFQLIFWLWSSYIFDFNAFGEKLLLETCV